jgi:hypothetical protein
MRAIVRALWLLACIWAHILRTKFPMRPLTRKRHRSRSLACWRELKELFRQEGIDLPVPSDREKAALEKKT